MRGISWVVLGLTAGGGLSWMGQAGPASGSGRGYGAADSCHLEELSRSELRLGSAPLYVQPLVFEASPLGEVLLLGKFTAGAGSSDLIGVVVVGDSVRPVRAAVPRDRMAAPTATWNDAGYWDVTLLETFEAEGPSPVDSSVLWHGRLAGGEWLALDRVDLPFDAEIRPLRGTSGVTFGDTLAWAGAVEVAPSPGHILVLRLMGGRWTGSLAPTVNGGDPHLAYSPAHGLLLAAVHPDPRLSYDGSSLFLWTRRGSSWSIAAKLADGSAHAASRPAIATLATGDISVAWLSDPPEGRPGRVAMVVPSISGPRSRTESVTLIERVPFSASPVPVSLPSTGSAWVVGHLGTDLDREDGWAAAVVAADGDRTTVLGLLEGPFLTRVNALQFANGEVLVTGGVRRPGYVTNLMIRLRIRCSTPD